jgi:hypothetical protein
MEETIRVTRQQLEAIIGKDNDAIRQFEKLFEFVNAQIETGVADGVVTAEAKANRAINEIFELKKELVALSILVQQNTSNISTNTTNISTNASDITALDVRVTALEP